MKWNGKDPGVTSKPQDCGHELGRFGGSLEVSLTFLPGPSRLDVDSELSEGVTSREFALTELTQAGDTGAACGYTLGT